MARTADGASGVVPINYIAAVEDDTPFAPLASEITSTTPPPKTLRKAWGSPERQPATTINVAVEQALPAPTPPSAAAKPKLITAAIVNPPAAPWPPTYSPAAARARAGDTHKRKISAQALTQESNSDPAVTANAVLSLRPLVAPPKPTSQPPTRTVQLPAPPTLKPSAPPKPPSKPPQAASAKTPPAPPSRKPDASPPTKRQLPPAPTAAAGATRPAPPPKPSVKPNAGSVASVQLQVGAISGRLRPPPPRKPPMLASPSPVSPEVGLDLPGQILSPARTVRGITEL